MPRAALTLGFVALLTGLVAAQVGPAQGPTGLSPDQIALMCAPVPADVPDRAPGPLKIRVTGAQSPVSRLTVAQGDLVTISAGERQGVQVGQQFYVRRPMKRFSKKRPASRQVVRTTGWLTVYAVDPDLSLATVAHACTTIAPGDELAPITKPDVPDADARDLEPKRGDYARITLGADGRQSFGTGDMFLIDRGSNKGVQPGSRFVLYRDRRLRDTFLFEAGEAVAVAVGAEATTLRMTSSTTAVMTGDLAGQRTEVPRHATSGPGPGSPIPAR